MVYCRKRKVEIKEPHLRAYCEIVDEYTTCDDCVFGDNKLLELSKSIERQKLHDNSIDMFDF